VRDGGVTATVTDADGNTSELSPILPTCQTTFDAVYLLITSDALAASFQSLADRRTAQGRPGLLVTVDWIAANYDGTRPDGGSDLQTRIRTASATTTNTTARAGCRSAATTRLYRRERCPRKTPLPICTLAICRGRGTPTPTASTGVHGRRGRRGQRFGRPDSVRTADQATAYFQKLVRYESRSPDGSRTACWSGVTTPRRGRAWLAPRDSRPRAGAGRRVCGAVQLPLRDSTLLAGGSVC